MYLANGFSVWLWDYDDGADTKLSIKPHDVSLRRNSFVCGYFLIVFVSEQVPIFHKRLKVAGNLRKSSQWVT